MVTDAGNRATRGSAKHRIIRLYLAGAVAVWVSTGAILTLLDCVEKSLTNLGDGHAIVGLLYLVPAWLLICAIVQWICLAGSFYTAVLR